MPLPDQFFGVIVTATMRIWWCQPKSCASETSQQWSWMVFGLDWSYLAGVYLLGAQPYAQEHPVAEPSAKLGTWPCGLHSQGRLRVRQLNYSRERWCRGRWAFGQTIWPRPWYLMGHAVGPVAQWSPHTPDLTRSAVSLWNSHMTSVLFKPHYAC